jgi:shikimate dehydrogenase
LERAAQLELLPEAGALDSRLANRTDENAKLVAQQFSDQFDLPVRAVPWLNRAQALKDSSLLVNATSQGMYGQAALDLDLSPLPRDAWVSDLVYVPLETPLLAAARARGNKTVGGLGMLLNQARPAFQSWFGVMPEITDALRTKVLATFYQS